MPAIEHYSVYATPVWGGSPIGIDYVAPISEGDKVGGAGVQRSMRNRGSRSERCLLGIGQDRVLSVLLSQEQLKFTRCSSVVASLPPSRHPVCLLPVMHLQVKLLVDASLFDLQNMQVGIAATAALLVAAYLPLVAGCPLAVLQAAGMCLPLSILQARQPLMCCCAQAALFLPLGPVCVLQYLWEVAADNAAGLGPYSGDYTWPRT